VRTLKTYLLLLLLLMIPSTLACHSPSHSHSRNTTLPTTRVETLSIYDALLQLYIRISAETTIGTRMYKYIYAVGASPDGLQFPNVYCTQGPRILCHTHIFNKTRKHNISLWRLINDAYVFLPNNPRNIV